MKLRVLFLFALPLAIAAAARAVIIDSGDGTGNTTAPSPDPGWDYVGQCNGLTVVYLGDGWVLTANHVGAGDCVFMNVVYPWAVGSAVQMHNPNNSLADLLVFKTQLPFPPLPDLPIASTPATSSAQHPLYLIGNGRDRGAVTTWDPCGYPPIDGYLWGPGVSKRWGTNFAEISPYFEPAFGTWVTGTVFDQSGAGHSIHEAQGAYGDSGGALFAWNGVANQYQLAGILIGIGTIGIPPMPPQCPNPQSQPAQTALYGNGTYAADLSVYRDEIVATMPEPDGALFAGIALLAFLPSAGTRRACRGTGRAASSIRRA